MLGSPLPGVSGRCKVSGHTPGPWSLEDSDTPHEATELVDAQGRKLTGVRFWLDDACFDFNPEREANHRLISAAPDLLEALKALLSSNDGFGRRVPADENKARAAIAKAEGK